MAHSTQQRGDPAPAAQPDAHAHHQGCTAPTFLGAKIATAVLALAALLAWLLTR